jgi:hypothetical protein
MRNTEPVAGKMPGTNICAGVSLYQLRHRNFFEAFYPDWFGVPGSHYSFILLIDLI